MGMETRVEQAQIIIESRHYHRRHVPVAHDIGFAYAGSWVLALLLVVASVAGLLYGDRGLYGADAALLPQLRGQDLVSLVLVLPVLLTSMMLSRRESVVALLVWAGALLYTAYSYFFYVVGVHFNALFPLYVALVSLSLLTLVGLLLRTDAAAVRARVRRWTPVRTTGVFLVIVGLMFGALWLGDVGRRLAAGMAFDPAARAVYGIDLAIILPVLVLSGVWLLQDRPWGYALAGVLLVLITGLMLTLVVATLAAALGHHPVSPAAAAVFGLTGLLALALAVRYLQGLRVER